MGTRAAELDIERPQDLLAYLRDTGRIERDEEPQVRNLAGGVSNRTVLLTRPSGEAWVFKQALAKLRVPVDWFSDPARIHREALGLRWLAQLAPPGTIAPLVFEDQKHHLLAMQAVPQPHENLKTLFLEQRIEADHFRQFGTLLGTVHRRAHEQREALEPVFADQSFFESLRLEPYYAYTGTQVAEATEFLTQLIADTRRRRLTLVHGDYSPKNILVYRGRLILLDHEVIHWGDSAFDLGFSLTHLLSKAHHVKPARRAFAAGTLTYWDAYRTALGDVPWTSELEPRAVRHTLACLLARVAGRSTLEYMLPEQRRRQRDAVLALLPQPPVRVDELVQHFLENIENHAAH